MAYNLYESADNVNHKNDVNYNYLYPVSMKNSKTYEIGVPCWTRRTDIKQQNKNVSRLTFVFEQATNTRWKQEVKRMCLNGINCRGTHQVKKVKELQCSQIIFCLNT